MKLKDDKQFIRLLLKSLEYFISRLRRMTDQDEEEVKKVNNYIKLFGRGE